MKGKGLIQFFAIALILVSIYQLSFNLVTSRVENRAQEFAESKVLNGKELTNMLPADKVLAAVVEDSLKHEIKHYKTIYLDSMSTENVFNLGFTSFTYQRCKDQQLNLGLDLQGGMNVVLQVSMRDLIRSLADNSNDKSFIAALDMADKNQSTETQKDYVTLFAEAFKKVSPNGKLASIFATKDNAEKIKYSSSDDEVIKIIRTEANSAFDRTYNILRSRIDKFGVTQPNITAQASTGRVTVELPGVDNPARVRKLLQASAKLEFWESYSAPEVYQVFDNVNKLLANRLTPEDTTATDTTKSNNSNPLLSGDVNDSTKTETAAADKKDTAKNTLANVKNDAKKDTAALVRDQQKKNPLFAIMYVPNYKDANGKDMVSQVPEVGYVLGRDTSKVNNYLNYDFVKSSMPRDIKFAWGAKTVEGSKNTYALYALKKQGNSDEPPLDGSSVIDARADVNSNNKVEVAMNMNQDGGKIWRLLTAKNKDRFVAIVLDDQVQSAPRVNEEIPNGRSSISGSYTQDEAKDLANILKAGKLPAPARIIAEDVVGPSLGAESIANGIRSMIIAFLCVLAFMVLYYSTSGLIANIALLFNLLFIIGILASISATLTLAGIAGIVLTMGIAVDANVLIHERIKEELKKGSALIKAMNDGHTKSYSAIFDSNLTTLITGIILAYFGMGPVLGYATTLNIGIIMTLFTAVFVAHIIMEFWVKRGWPISFKTGFTRDWTKYNIQFVNKRKYAYIFSIALTVICLVSIFTKGFQYGVDFTGGRTYVVQFDNSIKTTEVRDALTKVLGEPPVVKTYGGDNKVKITTGYLHENTNAFSDSLANTAIYNGVKGFYKTPVDYKTFTDKYKLSSSIIGPTISNDITTHSFYAVFLSLIAIFIYILVRFRSWRYSVGVIVSLIHDTIIVMGAFSLLAGFMPFTLEVDEQFVAAILTVIGYSVNDTVIVYDRIREFLREHPAQDMKVCINNAINSTLNRTITTHVTVFIVVLILFIFAGETVRGFSFAMLIGVVFGTYSSIFVATPLVIDLAKHHDSIRIGGTQPKNSVASKS